MASVTKCNENGDKAAPPFPLIGFGTADYPFGGSAETARDAIVHAIKIGYRHFDAAAVYQSEEPLGDAIAEALRLGLIQSRAQLFITTKLWPNDAHSDCVLPALHKSLKKLKLEYVDLYMLHWPACLKRGEAKFPFNKEDLLPLDSKSVWEAMEKCQEIGLTKFIGVSNFACNKLETLLATVKIPPLVNQVEMNPVWQQKKLREYCAQKGIYVVAYSPLGAKGSPWGTNQVMENETLKDIAAAKGKSIAQICIRWVYEQGVGVLVKSFNKERMQQNLDIFDWSLTVEESERIAQIPQRRGYVGPEFVSDQGPYKSLEELWDGEI